MSVDGEKVQDAPLQFDRVVHVDPAAASVVSCAECGGPVNGSYYHAGSETLCAACGARRQQAVAPDTRLATFGRATLYGLGGALVGALLYWGVMEYLGLEIGIVSIAIGYMVGRAVATATKGRSARRHRVLAVALTYFAVGLAYSPFFVRGMHEGKDGAVHADSTSARSDSATVPASAPSAAPSATSTPPLTSTGASLGAGAFAVGLLALLGMVLALPVIGALSSGASGLLSVLIIGIALRQAWRIAAASNATVTGPFAVGSAAA